MKKSLIRVLISLFLCCCLVLNVAAIPARATDFGSWLLHQIGTDIGVSAILEGLGIFRDAASDYFGELVNEVSDALDTAGQVSGGLMNAYYKVDPLGASSPLFAVPLSLITFVRNWLFDNHIVTDSNALNFAFEVTGTISGSLNPRTLTVNANKDVALVYVYYEYRGGPKGDVYAISTEEFRCTGDTLASSKDGVQYGYYYAASVLAYSCDYPLTASFPCIKVDNASAVTSVFDSPIVPSLSTDLGLSLGYIAPASSTFSVAYPQWLEHQRELEDGTTETVVQIGLGNTQAETESLTQEQIWTGQGTLQIPEQGQTEVTLQDILQGLIQLPGQMVTSIQTALQTFFVPSGNIQAYSLDLKALFPFCIPFDIYDFLAALSADPVPPVFEFDLNLGVATEPMKIDLSNWSDLAAIIRTLELGLFCVGLALKTRELIGG